MASKEGDGALEHCDPGLSTNPWHLLHLLVFGAESIYGHLLSLCFKRHHNTIIFTRRSLPMVTTHFHALSFIAIVLHWQSIYQKVPPHVAVAEVSMPVDCRGKLLHPLDLPQQLSHLDLIYIWWHLSLCLHLFVSIFGFGSAAAVFSSALFGHIWRCRICPWEVLLHLKWNRDDGVVTDKEGKSARKGP